MWVSVRLAVPRPALSSAAVEAPLLAPWSEAPPER